MIAREWENWEFGRRRETLNVYHHLTRFLFTAPSLQLSSMSDESLVLLYLSHSYEVELMATFTPADVISGLHLGSMTVGAAGIPAESAGVHQQVNMLIKFCLGTSGHLREPHYYLCQGIHSCCPQHSSSVSLNMKTRWEHENKTSSREQFNICPLVCFTAKTQTFTETDK